MMRKLDIHAKFKQGEKKLMKNAKTMYKLENLDFIYVCFHNENIFNIIIKYTYLN